jgi:hypothetical protein
MSDDRSTVLDVSQSQVTTDHSTIRRWADRRDGVPVSATPVGDVEAGALSIAFTESTTGAVAIPWERFFRRFEEANLAFVYEAEAYDGDTSHVYEFVDRRTL